MIIIAIDWNDHFVLNNIILRYIAQPLPYSVHSVQTAIVIISLE